MKALNSEGETDGKRVVVRTYYDIYDYSIRCCILGVVFTGCMYGYGCNHNHTKFAVIVITVECNNQ